VAQLPQYLTPPMLAKLRHLQLRPRRVVEGSVAGLHRSPWRGFSIEFAEHREYAPGDDLRHLDWKVFGRTDKYHLKQYEDETNLLCYLVLDVSQSMNYAHKQQSQTKRAYAQALLAALAHTVIEQRDAVGIAAFDNKVRGIMRPSSSRLQWEQLLSILELQSQEKKTNAGAVFHELAERFDKRGIVVIASDCFDNLQHLAAGLKHLTYKRHDVVLFHILDSAELDFPFKGSVEFEGLEDFPLVHTDTTFLRRAYLEEFQKFMTEVQKICRQQGIEYRLFRTDQPLEQLLAAWLSERMAKVR
jgi:uncharacterized protein (DUF58 family)